MTDPEPRPVTIVSGLPRSGTSMMMKMLAAGGHPVLTDHRRAADEDNPNGYYEYEPVKTTADDPSWLEQAGGRAVKMVYSLLRDLPADRRYRVVFMHRRMDEILASQRRMLERGGGTSAYTPDERMATLFERELDGIQSWLSRQPAFEVLHVDYNDLVQNPEPWIGKLNEFLGGGLQTEAMRRVVDPALYRQRVA